MKFFFLIKRFKTIVLFPFFDEHWGVTIHNFINIPFFATAVVADTFCQVFYLQSICESSRYLHQYGKNDSRTFYEEGVKS